MNLTEPNKNLNILPWPCKNLARSEQLKSDYYDAVAETTRGDQFVCTCMDDVALKWWYEADYGISRDSKIPGEKLSISHEVK